MNMTQQYNNNKSPDKTITFYHQDLEQMPVRTYQKEQALLQQIARDPHAASADEARTLLIQTNLRLVVRLARRYALFGPELADLIQEGNLALLKAVRHFDPQRNVHFQSFARRLICWTLSGVLTRYLHECYLLEEREWVHLPCAQVFKALAHNAIDEQAMMLDLPATRCIPLDALLSEQEGDSTIPDETVYAPVTDLPDETYLVQEQQTCVRACLRTLTSRERFVLTRRYLRDMPQTLEEIARALNITREYVRQIEVRAIRKLRHPSIARQLVTVL